MKHPATTRPPGNFPDLAGMSTIDQTSFPTPDSHTDHRRASQSVVSRDAHQERHDPTPCRRRRRPEPAADPVVARDHVVRRYVGLADADARATVPRAASRFPRHGESDRAPGAYTSTGY